VAILHIKSGLLRFALLAEQINQQPKQNYIYNLPTLQQMLKILCTVLRAFLFTSTQEVYIHMFKFFFGNGENFPSDILLQFFNCVRP
jgi:hypothetical protein